MASPLEEASKASVVGRKRKQPAKSWTFDDAPSNYGNKRQRVEDHNDYQPTDSLGESSGESATKSSRRVSLRKPSVSTRSSRSDSKESGEVSSSVVSNDGSSSDESDSDSEASFGVGQRDGDGQSDEVRQKDPEHKDPPARRKRDLSLPTPENILPTTTTRSGKHYRDSTPNGDDQSGAVICSVLNARKLSRAVTPPGRPGRRKLENVTKQGGLRGHIAKLASARPKESIESLVRECCAPSMFGRKHALALVRQWDSDKAVSPEAPASVDSTASGYVDTGDHDGSEKLGNVVKKGKRQKRADIARVESDGSEETADVVEKKSEKKKKKKAVATVLDTENHNGSEETADVVKKKTKRKKKEAVTTKTDDTAMVDAPVADAPIVDTPQQPTQAAITTIDLTMSDEEEEGEVIEEPALPQESTSKIVRKIPRSQMLVGCYNCGSRKHWGDDCPKHSYEARTRMTGGYWCAAFANQFVEPDEEKASENGDEPAWNGGRGGGVWQLAQFE